MSQPDGRAVIGTRDVAPEMLEAAHDADIAGGKHGRYRRIITALWPLIAAAERKRIGASDEQMAAHLREHGYLVAKIPPCGRQGRGHGRHTLITRSAICDGEEPMPHSFANLHQGSFGIWVHCACGRDFADYRLDDSEEPTPWEQHKAEHGITR